MPSSQPPGPPAGEPPALPPDPPAAHRVLTVAHRTPATARECDRWHARGVALFELDVQLLQGGLVVSHLLPPVPALPRLRQHRHRVTLRRRSRTEWDLETWTDLVPASAGVLLDLKNDRDPAAMHLAEAVLAAGLDPARFHVAGKHWPALRECERAGLPAWYSVAGSAALEAALAGAVPAGANVTVRHRLLTPASLPRLLDRFAGVGAWTVNDLARASVLARQGVTAITSDALPVLSTLAGPVSP